MKALMAAIEIKEKYNQMKLEDVVKETQGD